jgi:hypothetical protein
VVDTPPGWPDVTFDVHHLAEKLVVVFPLVWEPETEAGVVTVVGVGVGVVLAIVFVVLWVVEAPPLAEGAIMNTGCTVIAGWTLIIAVAEALGIPVCPRPCRAPVARPW